MLLVKHQFDDFPNIGEDLIERSTLRDDARLFQTLSDEPAIFLFDFDMQNFHRISSVSCSCRPS